MSEATAEAEVVAVVESGVGRLTLNRPKALHALNAGMCAVIVDRLTAWRDDPEVRLVMIDHAAGRGFCAGGDVRMLAASSAIGGEEARAFFSIEYQMNTLLMRFPKPILAVMDGVVMGGGVGLSLPCRYRLATERTVFAMPETGIGLFPDVGGGWHLPRLPGESGMWLALTGARIGPADCLALGVATHVAPSTALDGLKSEIARNADAVEAILADYALDPGPSPLAEHRATLDAAFSAASVEGVVAALEADGGAFATAQVEILRTKSPQTLKVAFRQLRIGRTLPSFEANMTMEYRIAARVVVRPDFREGVRALLIDKDNQPQWSPATLEGVDEALLDAIFAPLPPDEEWRPLQEAQ